MTEQEYNSWLNELPRIVKQNADGSEYVPISCVQEDLFVGYGGYTKMELLRESYHSEGLSGVGRLHYKHPISGEWLFQDGSASLPFQKGMRLDFPNLSSHIILSCAKKIGVRFGRDLNRIAQDAPIDQDGTNGRQKQPIDAVLKKKLDLAIMKGDEKTANEIKENYVI